MLQQRSLQTGRPIRASRQAQCCRRPVRVLAAVGNTAAPFGSQWKDEHVARLLAAKEKSSKSFTQIAKELGVTNIYAAQLFYNQAQLKAETVAKLQAAVPALTADDILAMQVVPNRRFDKDLIQEPSIYRLYEAIMHGGTAIKALINEECGDGIMSAIDYYVNFETVVGKSGEKRIVISMNGKYLPFVVQNLEDDVTR